MKRLTLILILHLAALAAMAQKGLAVNDVFEGMVMAKDRMIETEVRGSQLRSYNLTLFRSVKFNAMEQERNNVEATVNAVIPDAVEIEKERHGDHLYYAVMTLHPAGASTDKPLADDAKKRFLCYQCAQGDDGQYRITMVYMEGTATLQQLRKIFKKK